MSIITHNSENEVAILDCVQRFFSSHKVGSLLKKCNGTKEKGVPAILLFRYKLSNVFIGRSMYMLQCTGAFKEDFSKNTFYRFLNSAKINWLAFLCTNPDLSEEEIIRIYGKRWQVKVFFKTCKSTLNLIGECRSLSYDALTAHVAIVFTRYMLLALEQRKNEDQRTLGEIFFFLVDEMADILASAIGAPTNPTKISNTFKSERAINYSNKTISNHIDYLAEALHSGSL